MQFDSVDFRILDVLQKDAWLENKELARRVSLSPAACLRRVQKLRESGAISSVVALLSASKLGLEVFAYAFVSLENHRSSSGSQFESVIQKRPEVTECVRLSGVHDYLLRVVVESMQKYSDFLDRYILPLPAVRSVSTNFELGVLKRTTAMPLPAPRKSR